MRRVISTLLILAWGLWLGGLIVLFMAVSSLFKTFANNHETAGMAASAIFAIFNRYQLALAATALVTALILPRPGCVRGKWIMLAMFTLAAASALLITFWLTPHIERLRIEGATHSAEFGKLHGISMGIYLLETLLVFFAGLILPAVIDRDQRGKAGGMGGPPMSF